MSMLAGFLNLLTLFRRKPKPGAAEPPSGDRGTGGRQDNDEQKPKSQDDEKAADEFFATLPEDEWVKFDASNIWQGAFYSFGASGTLRIRFRVSAKVAGWNGVCAEYYGVDNHDWINLCAASKQGTPDSQGKYFYHNIRSRYPFSYV